MAYFLGLQNDVKKYDLDFMWYKGWGQLCHYN